MVENLQIEHHIDAQSAEIRPVENLQIEHQCDAQFAGFRF